MTRTSTAHCSSDLRTRCWRALADVVVEVLAGRTRHDLMPRVPEAEAVRLHCVVAAAVQAGEAVDAETAMRAIVAESATAIRTIASRPQTTPSAVGTSLLSGGGRIS